MAFPEKIKAAVVPQFGDIDVIQLGELPFPTQKPNEVLIKVNYAGVNYIDTFMRSGAFPPSSGRFPFTLGVEATGTIVKLPSDTQVWNNQDYKIRGLREGAPVIAAGSGAMAEYISVPWDGVFSFPHNVEPKIAVAAFLQGLTALTFITEAHEVKKGETVLIHTVAGGIGLLFAQLAHARGATVIGTTSTEEKAKVAKAHGADHVILYTKEDTVKRVLEITDGKGVHAVFDGVGKDTFKSNFEMLRRKGTLVSVGEASGAVPPFAPLELTPKNLKLLRPQVYGYLATPSEFYNYTKELFDYVSNGTVKIHIHAEYSFTAEGVQQAHRDVTGRKTAGKLLVKVSD